MSIRWLIAFVTLFLLLTLVSNILDAQAGFTTAQMADINAMKSGDITESKALADTTLGTGTSLTGFLPLVAAQALWKSLTLEYSFLYDTYYGMTSATCTATYPTGEWKSAISGCQVPNVWYLPFMLLLWGPIVGVGLYFLLYLLRGS